MRPRYYLVFGVLAVAMIGLAAKAYVVFKWNETKGPTAGPVHLLATIAIPGAPLSVFDVGWVDAGSRRFFLADQSNAGVDVIDTDTNRFVGRAGGFAGRNAAEKDLGGPNGLFAIPETGVVWAGDAGSKIRVVAMHSHRAAPLAAIDTHGAMHVDLMAYDPEDGVVVAANEADSPPFLSLISVKNLTVLHRLVLPEAWVGIEQTVWDRASHRFLASVPLRRNIVGQLASFLFGSGLEGEILSIDPKTGAIDRRVPTDGCVGTGLAMGLNGSLIQGCHRNSVTQIIDAVTGKAVTLTEAGGADEVAFNPSDGRYYIAAVHNAAGPVLAVVDARTNRWIQNVETAEESKSVAVDSRNDHVFVALTPNALPFDNDPKRGFDCRRGCIGVYGEK